jgi:Spy/CpxP family protein refolding chaperone
MTDAISWRNPKVLRVLFLVFLAGGLTGAVTFRIARVLLRRDVVSAVSNPPAQFPVKEKPLDVLQRELNLTPTQSDQVRAIIDDYKRYYGNIQDQVEEVRATGKSRILQVLDTEQRTKFEKLKLAENLK